MPVSKNAVGKDYYEFLDKVVSKRIDKPLITEAPVDIYDNTPYPNWAFQDESGYIENSIGIDKIFDLLTKNKNYCIVWIPYSDLYFSFNSNHSYNYQTFFADSKVVDGRYKSDNKDLLIQLISHYYFGIDIALQFGINILPVKYVNKILNSQYTFGTDKYFTYGSFKSNYQSPDGNNTYRFLSGFNGVIGFNFTLPVNFRIIFNNKYFINDFYEDFKDINFKDNRENITNYLINSNQYYNLIVYGIEQAKLQSDLIVKPSDDKLEDPLVYAFWFGSYPSVGNADFTNKQVWVDVPTNVNDNLYRSNKNKFFITSFTELDIAGKLFNTSLEDYYCLTLTISDYGFIRNFMFFIYEKEVLYFNFADLNIYISNNGQKRTLFINRDEIGSQLSTHTIIFEDNFTNQNKLKRNFKMVTLSDNKIRTLNFGDKNSKAPFFDDLYVSNINNKLELKRVIITTKSANYCVEVKTKDKIKNSDKQDMDFYNYKYTYRAFNWGDIIGNVNRVWDTPPPRK